MKIVPSDGERGTVVMNCGGKKIKISYQGEWNRKAESLGEAVGFFCCCCLLILFTEENHPG